MEEEWLWAPPGNNQRLTCPCKNKPISLWLSKEIFLKIQRNIVYQNQRNTCPCKNKPISLWISLEIFPKIQRHIVYRIREMAALAKTNQYLFEYPNILNKSEKYGFQNQINICHCKNKNNCVSLNNFLKLNCPVYLKIPLFSYSIKKLKSITRGRNFFLHRVFYKRAHWKSFFILRPFCLLLVVQMWYVCTTSLQASKLC